MLAELIGIGAHVPFLQGADTHIAELIYLTE